MLDDVLEGVFRLLFRFLAEILFEVFVELLFHGMLVPLGRGVARALSLGTWPSEPPTGGQHTACGFIGLLIVLLALVLLFAYGGAAGGLP